jgi:hypothetical protein
MTKQIRILQAEGALRDCTEGAVYTVDEVVPGVPVDLTDGHVVYAQVVPQEAGYMFLDDVGDTVGLQLESVDRDFAAGNWESVTE